MFTNHIFTYLFIVFLLVHEDLGVLVCPLDGANLTLYHTSYSKSKADFPSCYTKFASESFLYMVNCKADYVLKNFKFDLDGQKATKMTALSEKRVLVEIPNLQDPDSVITKLGVEEHKRNSISYNKIEMKVPYESFPKVIPKFSNTWGAILQENETYLHSYVSIMNVRTIVVHDLTFDNYNNCSDARFWIGPRGSLFKNGKPIPDQNGSDKPLQDFSSMTLVLQIPSRNIFEPKSKKGLTLCDLEYVAIYCPQSNFNYGFVFLTERSRMEKIIPPHFVFEKLALDNITHLQQPRNTFSSNLRPSYLEEEDNFDSFVSPTSSGMNLKPSLAVLLIAAHGLLVR